jgi:hypothetical protein
MAQTLSVPEMFEKLIAGNPQRVNPKVSSRIVFGSFASREYC